MTLAASDRDASARTSLPVLTAPRLAAEARVAHGFFTRRGGVSEGVWASLNMGVRSGDDLAAVRRNRARAAEALGVTPDRLVTARQVHGTACVRVAEPWSLEDAPEADALVTTVPSLAIGVLSADCAPVLLADAEAGAVGAAHAGWRGALAGVVEAVVKGMVEAGARQEAIVAAVGPCIGRRSYEVGGELIERFLAEDPESERFFREHAGTGRPHLDLEGYVGARLARAGVGAVDLLGRDTLAEPETFFSWRRTSSAGETRFGLQLSAIAPVARRAA